MIYCMLIKTFLYSKLSICRRRVRFLRNICMHDASNLYGLTITTRICMILYSVLNYLCMYHFDQLNVNLKYVAVCVWPKNFSFYNSTSENFTPGKFHPLKIIRNLFLKLGWNFCSDRMEFYRAGILDWNFVARFFVDRLRI